MSDVSPVTVVVRGGTVVNADGQGLADVFISGEQIAALVRPGTPVPVGSEGAVVIDAANLQVLPGGVDPHCHVGFTSGAFTTLDDHVQATTAAVFGGTTTIVDFAIPRPGETPAEAAAAQLAKLAGGYCDVALHGCVISWDDTVPAQLDALAVGGVRTVKMFTTYRDETMADDYSILRVMSHLKGLGGLVLVHCEANHLIEETQRQRAAEGRLAAEHHHDTRTELAESASVAEVLAIAESLDAPVYFVHQSTPAAVDLVADARRRGVAAFTECVTHHLVLDNELYAGPQAERYVCCPPLRSAETVAALRERASYGAVNTIGSDHCCYDSSQKESARDDVRTMPNGLPGVETRLPVSYSELVTTGLLPIERFVDLTSTTPARLNGLYPRKGVIQPGSDADLVIWDPHQVHRVTSADLHMATDYTPYEGMEVTGMPRTVLVRGQVQVHGGELVGSAGLGRFVPAAPLGDLRTLLR